MGFQSKRPTFTERLVLWGSISLISIAVFTGSFLLFQRLRNDNRTSPPSENQVASDVPKYHPVVLEGSAADDPDEPFIIAAVGDMSLGRSVKKAIGEGIDPFASARDTIMAADLAVANLECAITDNPERGNKGTWGGIIYLKGDPMSSHLIGGAGFDYVSLANNHTMDYGNDGLRDTMDALDFAGIAYSGAGVNTDEAYRPAILHDDGYSIALFSFCFVEPREYAAGQDKWGVAWFNRDRVKEALTEYAPTVDLTIVSMHWGVEGETEPSYSQRDAARMLIDAGADIILGHHNHRLGPIEVYKDGLIAYSLGNFVFDTGYRERRKTAILTLFVDRETGLLGYSLTPYLIEGVSPKPVESDKREMVRLLR